MWVDLYHDLSIFTFISWRITVDPIANTWKNRGKPPLVNMVGLALLPGGNCKPRRLWSVQVCCVTLRAKPASEVLFVGLTKSFFLVQYCGGSLSPPTKLFHYFELIWVCCLRSKLFWTVWFRKKIEVNICLFGIWDKQNHVFMSANGAKIMQTI